MGCVGNRRTTFYRTHAVLSERRGCVWGHKRPAMAAFDSMDVGAEHGHGNLFSSVDIVPESYADWESMAQKEGMATGFFSGLGGGDGMQLQLPAEEGLREKGLTLAPEQGEMWGLFNPPPPTSLIKMDHANPQPGSPQQHGKGPWERAEPLFGAHQAPTGDPALSAPSSGGAGMCDAIDSGNEAPSNSEPMWSADEMEVPAEWVDAGSSWMSGVEGSFPSGNAALSAEGGDGAAAAARAHGEVGASHGGAPRHTAPSFVIDEDSTASSRLKVSVKEFAAAVKQRFGSNRKARGTAGRSGARGSGRSASRTRGGGNRRASSKFTSCDGAQDAAAADASLDRSPGGVQGMASSGASLSHKAQHCVREFVAGFRKRIKKGSAADKPSAQAHQVNDAKGLLCGGKAALEMEEEAPTRRSKSWPSALAIAHADTADNADAAGDHMRGADLGISPLSPGAKRGRGAMAASPCSPRAGASSNAMAGARSAEAAASAAAAARAQTSGKSSQVRHGSKSSQVRHVIQTFQARIRMKNTRLNTDDECDHALGGEQHLPSEQHLPLHHHVRAQDLMLPQSAHMLAQDVRTSDLRAPDVRAHVVEHASHDLAHCRPAVEIAASASGGLPARSKSAVCKGVGVPPRSLLHVHTYIRACIHAYMHAYVYACIHPSIHTCMHTYILTFLLSFLHTCMHACIHAYMHTHRHKHKHKHTHTHTHTHTHACIHTDNGRTGAGRAGNWG